MRLSSKLTISNSDIKRKYHADIHAAMVGRNESGTLKAENRRTDETAQLRERAERGDTADAGMAAA
jgi:hypothetical protein